MDGISEEAAKLGWGLVGRRYPFETPWMKLVQDDLSIPGKGTTSYTYHCNPGSVCIVPVSSTGKMYLIRQYRYPVNAWCWEVPAGGFSHKSEQISKEALAREELLEELGATCEQFEFVAQFFPGNSYSQEICFVYLAHGTRILQEQHLDDSEVIQVCPMSVSDAFALVRSGQVQDSYSALSLFLCESRLRALGYFS